MELERLTDREILVQVVSELGSIKVTLATIVTRQERTNGQVAELKTSHYEQRGALAVLRIMMMVTLAGIGAGAAVASVILAIVTKGV